MFRVFYYLDVYYMYVFNSVYNNNCRFYGKNRTSWKEITPSSSCRRAFMYKYNSLVVQRRRRCSVVVKKTPRGAIIIITGIVVVVIIVKRV